MTLVIFQNFFYVLVIAIVFGLPVYRDSQRARVRRRINSKRVVVESPYGHTSPVVRATNRAYLRACMRDCVERGESPYASHGLLTQPGVLNDLNPEDRQRGITSGYLWGGCGRIVLYTDRGISDGMQRAIEHYGEDRIERRSLGRIDLEPFQDRHWMDQ